MTALAILEMNTHTSTGIARAVSLLGKAYQLEPENPVVLNHLANHFFYKKDMTKVEQLAQHAFQVADTEAVRAESCFQLARCYHYQKVYDKAFRHYYQATQFASPSFILPQFGLGQLYIQRSDYNQAISCFEKIIKAHPQNIETLKILGSLYANTEPEEPTEKKGRLDKARETLTKVVEMWPDDIESLIDLAQLLEFSEPQKSLNYYTKASEHLQEREGLDPPAEILNNMGSLHFALGDYSKARDLYSVAVKRLAEDVDEDPDLHSLLITVRYNLARSLEMLCLFDDAEKLYKEIIMEKGNYVDCIMRLGCMARDRGQIFDSSVWFKEALTVSSHHADAWTLIGNLHMAKHEWGPAQKKFEQVHRMKEYADDAYANIAVGNIWLETLFAPNRNKEKDKAHGDRALALFSKTLKAHPKNIWAANGIGCVLAARGFYQEARDIFAQCREATAELPDVWMNLAHVYMEQKQYVAAVQMYANAAKKFGRETDTNLLLCLSKAYFKAGKFAECRETLERASVEAPDNLMVKVNHAFVLEQQAKSILKDEKATLEQVTGAVDDLKIAEKMFTYIANNRDDSLSGARLVSRSLAASEASSCSDLLKQAQTYVTRAQAQDDEEREQKARQKEEMDRLRAQMEEEGRLREEQTKAQMEQLKETRQLYVQMTKDILRMPQVVEEKTRRGGGGGRRRKGDGDEFVNDSSDMGDWEGGETGERKKHSGGSKARRRESRKKREQRGAGDASGSDEEREDKERRKKHRKKDDFRLSAKQSAKVKSRAFLSSEESSDDEPKQRPTDAGPQTESPPPAGLSSSSSASLSDDEEREPKKKAIVKSDSSSSPPSPDARPDSDSDAAPSPPRRVLSSDESD